MNALLRLLSGTRLHLRVLMLVTLLLGISSVGGSATSCIEYDTYGREVVDDRCVAAGEEAAEWPDFDSTALGDQVLKIELAKAAAAEEASLWPDHNLNDPDQTQRIAQVAPGTDDDGSSARGTENATLVGSDAEREQVAQPTDQQVIHTTGIAPR